MPPRKSKNTLETQQASFKSALKSNAARIPARLNVASKTQTGPPRVVSAALEQVARERKRRVSFAIPETQVQKREKDNRDHMVKLVAVIQHIKEMGEPVKKVLLERRMSGIIDARMVSHLKAIPGIVYNEVHDTFEFMNIYGIKTKERLLWYLKDSCTTDMSGVDFKELKEGWPDALKVINELEKEGEVFVNRIKNGRNHGPKTIWYKDRSLDMPVDDDLQKLFRSIKVPIPASTLPRILTEAGLKPAGIDPTTVKVAAGRRERKKPTKRRGTFRYKNFITNTHMSDLLVDYSGKASEKLKRKHTLLYD